MIVKEALTIYAKSNEKQWQQDRSQTVGGSEIGACARKTYFGKNEGDEYFGAHRDEEYEDTWGAKVRGSVFEDAFWVPAMRKVFGHRIMFTGNEQRTFKSGTLTATPDGFLAGLTETEKDNLGLPKLYSGGLVMDCKSIDPRVNLTEPKPEHVFQVQVQMGLMREVGHTLEYGLLSYANASDWSDIKEFLIKFDQAVYDEAKKRADNIMFAESGAALPAEGIMAGGRECEYCAFTKACGEIRNSRVPKQEAPDIDPQVAGRIIHAAHERNSLKKVAEEASLRLKETDETIRNLMQQAKTRKFQRDGVTVSWSAVKGRAGWDNKAIREAYEMLVGEDAVDKFKTEGDPSDRLTVTVLK